MTNKVEVMVPDEGYHQNWKDVAAKLIVSATAFLICLSPFWVYLACRWLFSPHGFWQNIFLFGVGVYFLGAIQLVLFVVFIIVLMAIWAS